MQVQLEYIIKSLRDNQSGKVWVGSNFDRMLSKIDDSNAFIRPAPEMHSVAEIISHLTTWQKETIIKIETGRGTLTDDCEQNWYSNDILKDKKWASILEEYKSSLNTLINSLEAKDDSFLEEEYYDADFKGNYPHSFVIDGMLHHNIYHLGQLGIIVKYLRKQRLIK